MPTPPTIRIVLNEDQSAALDRAGAGALSIIHRGSYPETPGRWVIDLAPINWAMAEGASKVLRGTHRAVKIQTKHTR